MRASGIPRSPRRAASGNSAGGSRGAAVPARVSGVRRARPGRGTRTVRSALGVAGAALGTAVALRHGLRPAAHPWQGVVAAGWSLGLIPVHVAAPPSRRRAAAQAPTPSPADEGTGPRWQRGHQ